jgi:uncharacterized protein
MRPAVETLSYRPDSRLAVGRFTADRFADAGSTLQCQHSLGSGVNAAAVFLSQDGLRVTAERRAKAITVFSLQCAQLPPIIRIGRINNPDWTDGNPDMADRKPQYFPRYVTSKVKTALKDTPVVLLNGPRQCGKTTLLQNLPGSNREYVTLDDESVLAAARQDPVGFVRNFHRVAIDEVQRAPDLLRAIKKSVDENREPGRFLLTGSADILALPRASESLAGRMEIVTLLGLSRAEIIGHQSAFFRNAFLGRIAKAANRLRTDELTGLMLAGGYPEMLSRSQPARRRAWARGYLKAIIERDVRDIADVERLEQLPKLLRALAHHASQLANFTQLGGQIGLDDKSTRKYVGLLEQLFLVRRLEPWSRNKLKRLIKTPKLHFLDAGLLAALSGASAESLVKNRTACGALLETFVFAELVRQSTWFDDNLAFCYYRDKDQNEVDIVVENEAGEIAGIEVKASATAIASDFRGLRRLADLAGNDFKLGVVLYDGDQTLPFGEKLFAAPINSLWA